MELYAKDPAVTRAIALTLMRQALGLLDAVDEVRSARHLRRSIDTLLKKDAGDTGPAEA